MTEALADRYVVRGEVGRGGMATVYLADDLRHGRQVAVKILRPELGTILGPDRFTREIRIAAALNHPHILPLYDSGEVAGRLFYVMPMCGAAPCASGSRPTGGFRFRRPSRSSARPPAHWTTPITTR